MKVLFLVINFLWADLFQGKKKHVESDKEVTCI